MLNELQLRAFNVGGRARSVAPTFRLTQRLVLILEQRTPAFALAERLQLRRLG